jgi:hypothetical protein
MAVLFSVSSLSAGDEKKPASSCFSCLYIVSARCKQWILDGSILDNQLRCECEGNISPIQATQSDGRIYIESVVLQDWVWVNRVLVVLMGNIDKGGYGHGQPHNVHCQPVETSKVAFWPRSVTKSGNRWVLKNTFFDFTSTRLKRISKKGDFCFCFLD